MKEVIRRGNQALGRFAVKEATTDYVLAFFGLALADREPSDSRRCNKLAAVNRFILSGHLISTCVPLSPR